ncbi:hypothetical protein Pyn_02969 [Prunus yedoensis var. nudiflora]|uniref:Uncharacterized protein n=1 Tax=Prunus yedoensis var. nudiflora TaxID=2094558 RepID=A0A314YTF4_PRUYE|nr:hypothetical protein Pyn_02969 [Prunus yedoensis var. nudiflora]
MGVHQSTPLVQQVDRQGSDHSASISRHPRQEAVHRLPPNTRSITNATRETLRGCNPLCHPAPSQPPLLSEPPPLSVAAITDSAQQFAAISSFYLPLFLSVRKLNWQQLVQISKRFLEQFAAFLPLSEIL